MAKTISIIGLGQIGTAAIFALGRYAEHIRIHAYDPDPARRQMLIETGAPCEPFSDLTSMIQSSDVILDCSPYTSVKKNMKTIAGALSDEAIYCCCAPNKQALSKMFADIGGEAGKFLGLVVSTNRSQWKYLSAKRVMNEAEMFAGAPIGISAGLSAEEISIKRALDLVELLGGKGVLMDHNEADLIENRMFINLILAASAATTAAISEPGWGENEKFANFSFGRMVDIAGIETPKDLAEMLIDAPNGALRWMDARANAEKEVRSAINAGNAKRLADLFLKTSNAFNANEGLFDREKRLPEEKPRSLGEKLLKRFSGRND